MSHSNRDELEGSPDDFFPSSVEEAGALLGMSITQLTITMSSTGSVDTGPKVLSPPVGMHSSFRVLRPATCHSNLLCRLYQLRALLRSNESSQQNNKPLAVAPSLLAVLVKLIGVSQQLAPAYNTYATTGIASSAPHESVSSRPNTPPMLAHALRQVWVDCVTLCHVRGYGLSGTARIDTSKFIRSMLTLASQNPRSARAAGGVRIAALDVVAAILPAHDSLVLQTAPWALDVLQVCLKALKSAGNGEATYRQAAVQTAIAVAVASRRAQVLRQLQANEQDSGIVLPGAMEDKALAEAIKLLKQATQDKVPEVRCAAASFAAHLAPLLFPKTIIMASRAGTGDSFAEEALHLAWKQLDDEASAYMIQVWAEAIARMLAATLSYHLSADKSGGNNDANTNSQGMAGAHVNTSSSSIRVSAREDSAGSDDGVRTPTRTTSSIRAERGGRLTLYSQATLSLKRTLHFLVDQFIKVGGELVASRLGGTFSSGGRAVRIGIGLVISHLLQLRSAIGPGIAGHLAIGEFLRIVLQMVGGPDMEKQLRPPDAGAGSGALGFGGGNRNWSKADAGVARAITCMVLRNGLGIAPEPVQLSLFQELVNILPAGPSTSSIADHSFLNSHQLQCSMVELSHLITTLGEAITSKIPELVVALKNCLIHEDWGVRHEAAVACWSLSVVHPDTGRDLIMTALSDIQMHHAQLMTWSQSPSAASTTEEHTKSGLRMFRRNVPESNVSDSGINPHQNAIHGLALMVSLLVREMPNTSGGLPSDLALCVTSVSEILVASQFSDILVKASGGSAASMCVRMGFFLISGMMSLGPKAISKHVQWIFGAWQRATNTAKVGGDKMLAPNHDLVCVDAVLYSVVVFLKHCTELLLAVPQALTHITVILEDIMPLLMADGRLGSIPLTPHISARLESARASLLEAFSWLPAGSYPMAADSVFAFAAENIQSAVYSEIACSILPELLSKEDSLLDTSSLARIKREGQSGASLQVEQTVLLLTAEFSHPVEREAVVHLQGRKILTYLTGNGEKFRQSYILGAHCEKNQRYAPPTPLHEVGMWRRPMDPSPSAKIRLVDAAVQAFAGTFGLKSGKEQQSAMNMLEALVPQYFGQITRTLNSSLTEQSKVKDDSAPAVSNITAVLLLCLQSLPFHESTHNIPIGLGPPWMNKAKDILLTVLPSASNSVRRAAAEGLALLATLGVSEDAHFLQSTVLHSLDELRQGNKPDGKPRAIASEPISAARAGSLLTLGCIQRTANIVAQRQLERARGRVESSKTTVLGQNKDSQLPLLQMMTRILPSIVDYGFTDFFEVRTFALHSFQILLAYSSRLDKGSPDDVDKQLLRKAVDIVEDNVCSAWLVASNDLDKGHDGEKMASEYAFLAVLLRLMSFIIPYLKILLAEDNNILPRFCVMARLILERHGDHPGVAFEGFIFYEVLMGQLRLLPSPSPHISAAESLRYSMTPIVFRTMTPARLKEHAVNQAVLFSFKSVRSAVFLVQTLVRLNLSLVRIEGGKILGLHAAIFEFVTGNQQFLGTGLLRSMVVPRRVEWTLSHVEEIVGELVKSIPNLVLREPPNPEKNYPLLVRCLLFARVLLSGAGFVQDQQGGSVSDKNAVIQAALLLSQCDAGETLNLSNSPRWQSKMMAAQIAAYCLKEILSLEQRQSGIPTTHSHQFDPVLASKLCAKQCEEAGQGGQALPNTLLAFHLQEIVSSACMSSVAALDHSELLAVQESSLHFLSNVIRSFSQIPDPEMAGSGILHQYSQQIFSVVKHSLSSADEVQTEASFRVFLAGCKTVSVIVKEKMTSEKSILKRLIRPMVPSELQLSFGSVTERKPDPPFLGCTYSNLIKVAKIAFTGDLLFGGSEDASLDAVSEEFIKDRGAFGVECALVALEGALLLSSQNLSLAGIPSISNDEIGSGTKITSSLKAYNSDRSAIDLVTSSWPSCSRAAVKALTSVVRDGSVSDAVKQECFLWIKALGTVVLQGCEDSINAIANRLPQQANDVIDSEDVLLECLCSMSLLMNGSDAVLKNCLDLQAVGLIARQIQRKLVEPILTEKTKTIGKAKTANQLCAFYRDLSLSLSRLDEENNQERASLISLILCPLDILQKGRLKSQRDVTVLSIINASQDATACLVKSGHLPDILVKSLADFVARDVLQPKDKYSIELRDSAKALLIECMSHSGQSVSYKKWVTLQMAQTGQWDVWGLVYKLNGEDVNDTESLIVLKQVFLNALEPDAHAAALTSLVTLVQCTSPAVARHVLASVGAEVVNLLCYYGTLASTLRIEMPKRHLLFGDSMRVILAFYQQISTDSTGLSEFLAVLFEAFLAVLRFNGLPNHPSPQEKGEPVLGRIVAQAVLHVARTSPEPFKTCMGTFLGDQDRAILEFSVRGEMTGYAPTANAEAPVKKKLDLKSFKK